MCFSRILFIFWKLTTMPPSIGTACPQRAVLVGELDDLGDFRGGFRPHDDVRHVAVDARVGGVGVELRGTRSDVVLSDDVRELLDELAQLL
jgi:hypothetical protein